ncbi:MAG: sulfite oxidase heme-binding subunit YedZ [Campylobacterota bacterium]
MRKVIINLVFVLPLVYLLSQLFIFEVADPIKYIYTITGVAGTVILFLSITISMIKKRVNLIKYRRAIGLWGFFYAFLHMLNFIIFDAQMSFSFVLKETLDKPFIYLGMIAMFILLFMAITSTKRLFKKFKKFHRAIYIALLLITIHFVMAQKSINIELFIYVGVIILIGYYKLLQIIVKNNNVST